MPLRDHFRSPVNDHHSWEGFHGFWPAMIVQHLEPVLPKRFIAEPRVHLGTFFEVDVAAFDDESPFDVDTQLSNEGGVATAVWAPPEPTLTVETDAADASEYEVFLFDIERERRLVAAIEIVSPSNKDPES